MDKGFIPAISYVCMSDMIDINQIKRTYAQMSDKKLLELAESGLGELTSQAKIALQDEMQKRSLDTSAFKAFNERKAAQKAASLSANWELAFEARKEGKEEAEIMALLQTKGRSQYESQMIVKRLPQTGDMDEDFEALVYENCESSSFHSKIGFVLIYIVVAFLFYWGIKLENIVLIIGAIGLGALVWYLKGKSKGVTEGGKFWVDMIRERPENIVWIKPIVTKHTAYYVLTLFTENKFEFLTKEGQKIVMNCNTREQQETFIDGVRQHLPHAQFGYSLDIAVEYDDGPEDFIDALAAKNHYTPIDRIAG
jgi:hypothetical protein